ncbi:MAG: GAF domain-containing protein [Anaerolineae bacterium]|nr:GAF domain-containing protein [Anaerolineae bacterium]
MSLRVKLISIFLLMTLLVLVIGLVNIQLIRETTQRFSHLTDTDAPTLVALGKMHFSATKLREETLGIIFLPDEIPLTQANSASLLDEAIQNELQEIEAAKNGFDTWFAAYMALVSQDTSHQDLVLEMERVREETFETSDAIVALVKSRTRGESVLALRDTMQVAEHKLDALIEDAIELEATAFENSAEDAHQKANYTYAINLTSILLGMSFVILIGLIVTRNIGVPIDTLKAAAEKIGRGYLDTTVTMDSGDEFEFLGRVFNQMALDLSQTTVSKAYLDNVIDSMGETLLVLDLDHTIQRVNQAALDLLEYKEADLLGCPAGAVFAENTITDLFIHEKVRQVETTYRTQLGDTIPVLLSSTLLRGDEGQIQGIVCVAVDISERRRMEDALRYSEEQLQQVFASISDHIYLTEVTPDGRRINQIISAVEKLTGYSTETILADHEFWPEVLIHPDDKVLATWQFAHFLQGHSSEIEYRMIRADGELIWVRDSGRVEKRPDSGNLFIYGVVSNITRRKQAEEALREREAQLVEAQRIAKLGYWRHDLVNNTVQWSDQIYAIYEVAPDVQPSMDLIGSKMHPDDWKNAQNVIQSAFEGNVDKIEAVYRLLRRNGIGYVNIIGNVVRDASGKLTAYYGTTQDITERKQAEITLQRSNEQLTAMYEIAQLISSTLNLEVVLDSIAQSTTALLGADACTIRLLDENSQTVNIVGAYGISRQMIDETRYKVGEQVPGQVVLSNYPMIIPDLPSDPYLRNSPAMKEGLLSCAIVPLKVSHKTIGTLDAHSKTTKNAFYENDLHLLEKLAGQAAIAIENSRLFHQEQQQRQLAESLQEVAMALNSHIDQKTLLDTIFSQLKRVIYYDGAGILLKEGNNLVLIADTSDTDADIGFALSLFSNDPAVRVFNQKHLSVVPDVHADMGWEIWDGGERIRGWMGAPLIVNNEPIGVITADSFEVNTFQAKDARILQVFASQAAVALNNAHLLQREQRQRQVSESLREVSTVINSSLDQEYVISKIFEELQQVIHYDSAAIFLLERDSLELKAGKNLPENFLGTRIPLNSQNPTLMPFTRHRSKIIADVHQHPHWFDRVWKNGERIRSWGGAPLLINDEALGVLTLDNFTANSYNESDAQLLQLFANHAAIAIQNARLYAVAQREIMEQERIAQDLEKARDQALEVSRLKSQLLARVSHELRTPLGAIIGYSELLQSGTFGPVTEKQHKVTSNVIESAQYLTDLVNELLDQAQLESGKTQMTIGSFTPAELIDPVLSKMHILAQAKGLKLTLDLDPNLPQTLFGDKNKLHQVLVNLISNAIKFTKVGHINVHIYPSSAGRWAIQVSDTGAGIPDEAWSYIFEPFRQVDESPTREYGGTGLGLSIVKQMVTLMGGDIDLASKENTGSTFTVSLPFIPNEERIS